MTAAPPILGTETYISFADANALASDRLSADDWRAAVAAEAPTEEAIPARCRQALITATATLDRLAWSGTLATTTQPLAWPRQGLPIVADPIPTAIATACAELAFHLLSPEGRPRRGVQTVMIGQSMETYFAEVADELPKHVRRLVQPFLRVPSSHSAELLP